MSRASYRADKDDRRGAMEDADTVIRLDPRSPAGYVSRALVRWKIDDLDRALADCDEALRLDPRDPAIHLIRGLVLGMKGDFWHMLGEVVLHPVIRSRVKFQVRWN